MPVALLFDLDGTLIQGEGAGSRAMLQAVREWAGVPVVHKPDMAGRTDPEIFREMLAQLGFEDTTPPPELMDLYLVHLEREVGKAPGRAAPGVKALLEACQEEPRIRMMALATGNVEAGARIKLEPHGMNGFFPVGGYGSDSRDRPQLVGIALQRARVRAGVPDMPGVVIGDTPRDVAAARANGMRCIAVATGPYDVASLEAAGADWVFEDLTRVDAFFEAVWACARRGA